MREAPVQDHVCERCAQVHVSKFGGPTCTKHLSSRDEHGNLQPCKGWRMQGQEVCRKHGGASKKAKAAGARRLAAQADRRNQELALKKAAQIFGLKREVDPAVGLIEEYWRSAAMVDAYERIAGGLSADDLSFGVLSERTKTKIVEVPDEIRDTIGDDVLAAAQAKEVETTVTRGARQPTIVRLLNEERDRFSKLGIAIVSLNLEARRDEYVRAQVDVFAGVLGQLNLTDEQRKLAASLLRSLDGRPRVVDADVVDAPH